jgi:TRAP-type C4-dicarboxylate transport system permease small subunit
MSEERTDAPTPPRPAPRLATRGASGRARIASRVLLAIDRTLDVTTVGLLVAMIVIVFVQVLTRKLLSFVFIWSEEVTMLCLTWFCFVGIAIGFREKVHLAMDVLANVLPRKANRVLDRIIDLSVFAFGVYLVVYGWQFTLRMRFSTLAATNLPNSVQYVVVPITGALICLYAALQLFGVDTRRFQHVDEEIQRDDA